MSSGWRAVEAPVAPLLCDCQIIYMDGRLRDYVVIWESADTAVLVTSLEAQTFACSGFLISSQSIAFPGNTERLKTSIFMPSDASSPLCVV